ncbi:MULTISPECIES: NUDIX hydrolase [unclassified Shinella]|uniref:NUDIX hydrolase n=1 Tax=unclassified Shinella TaxID=2643062 RepID=UPI00225D74D3|nr:MULTISPECIES: NUDIX hydrolase [unclassified Shinella]MCO5136677.1 NUDIX hydrolase [Shinella sp.]MDC7253646.1 NUDIX hydrolase [Shinella sp. YE25]CAI0336284.1 NTP pyrophosphohydrolase [Rhizobiaceae bacterium]CAK7254827.1 diphosphoinositol-polyphosphate diphosphatase [Shinella sp. WSC3-e]
MNILNRIVSDVHLMFRRPAREQYGALCYRVRKKKPAIEILLITSRDTGRWVIPKGWPMDGKSAAAAAAREAWEEAGVRGSVREAPIGSYNYLKGLPHGLKVDCRVRVFPLSVDDLSENFPEKDERRAEWVTCQEAARRVQEPGLKDLILAFERTMLAEIGPNGTPDA